jgi:hypothetical protein
MLPPHLAIENFQEWSNSTTFKLTTVLKMDAVLAGVVGWIGGGLVVGGGGPEVGWNWVGTRLVFEFSRNEIKVSNLECTVKSCHKDSLFLNVKRLATIAHTKFIADKKDRQNKFTFSKVVSDKNAANTVKRAMKFDFADSRFRQIETSKVRLEK